MVLMAKNKKEKTSGPVCKYCGRPLKAEESISMECGIKCYKKMMERQQLHLDKYFLEE